MLAEQRTTFGDTSRELYDLLIKPALEQLKDKSTVCVVPEGVLWDLPFRALLAKMIDICLRTLGSITHPRLAC